jgi:hypothetical protein
MGTFGNSRKRSTAYKPVETAAVETKEAKPAAKKAKK